MIYILGFLENDDIHMGNGTTACIHMDRGTEQIDTYG